MSDAQATKTLAEQLAVEVIEDLLGPDLPDDKRCAIVVYGPDEDELMLTLRRDGDGFEVVIKSTVTRRTFNITLRNNLLRRLKGNAQIIGAHVAVGDITDKDRDNTDTVLVA
ncbi:MAG TPA: hypothetical protein VM581_00270 [Magnetospirillaceae bacterium]|nr:hypothetical protein [Magnetospirillaceae bacterium]